MDFCLLLQQLANLLRELQGRGVMVVAISRVSVGCDLGMSVRQCLGGLPADAGRQLLLSSVGRSVSWDAADILRLVAICGGNSLAIIILARLIGNEHCSIQASQLSMFKCFLDMHACAAA